MARQQSYGVTPLDAGESVQAGRMLARAFQTDPLWIAILGDADRRPEMLAGMFTGLVKAVVVQGVAEMTPDLSGVALWLPPGKDIGLWAMVRSGLAMPRFVMSLPRQDRKRMMTVLRQIGERRTLLMPEPHWYLAAIGVDPEFQGTRLGSVLMRHGLTRADRDNRPIYLETESEGNVGFYQHLGFDVIEEFRPEGLDLQMWLMARQASPPHP